MDRKPFLGQVPLVLGPSSWGATIPFASEVPLQNAYVPTPPFYVRFVGADGTKGGTVGPFESVELAREGAALALRKVSEVDAALLPRNVVVVDSAGRVVASITP